MTPRHSNRGSKTKCTRSDFTNQNRMLPPSSTGTGQMVGGIPPPGEPVQPCCCGNSRNRLSPTTATVRSSPPPQPAIRARCGARGASPVGPSVLGRGRHGAVMRDGAGGRLTLFQKKITKKCQNGFLTGFGEDQKNLLALRTGHWENNPAGWPCQQIPPRENSTAIPISQT